MQIGSMHHLVGI